MPYLAQKKARENSPACLVTMSWISLPHLFAPVLILQIVFLHKAIKQFLLQRLNAFIPVHGIMRAVHECILHYGTETKGFWKSHAVEDRAPPDDPLVNEPGGGMMPTWKSSSRHIASTIFSTTSCGSANTAAGS